MLTWWASLSGTSQGFFVAAVFFSTLFIWQLVSSIAAVGDTGAEVHAGDAGGAGADAHVDVGGAHVGDMHAGDMHAGDVPNDVAHDLVHDGAQDQAAQHEVSGLHTFRLLSIRSLLAFGTLFSWAGALYLQQDGQAWWAVLRAVLWGFAGLLVVALFFFFLPRLTEEGTATLDTAVGRSGQVYMDIPANGVGQVRVLVGNTIKFVKARSRSGEPLSAGTSVRVVDMVDSVTIEVEASES